MDYRLGKGLAMTSSTLLSDMVSAIRRSPTAGTAWAAAEECVQQGTRVEGASEVAWAMVEALENDPRRVKFLGRPIIQLCQGDPWSKFPHLLSNEQFEWAVSDFEAERCDAAGRAAARVCEAFLEDADQSTRQFARLLVFWSRPDLASADTARCEATRIDRLEQLICRLFTSRAELEREQQTSDDPLLMALSSRQEIGDARLSESVAEVLGNDLCSVTPWFDGDLTAPLLFAAKCLRNDLPKMMRLLLEQSSDAPFRVQAILASAVRLSRQMQWTDEDKCYFSNVQIASKVPGWRFAELDTLRGLALARS